MKPEIKTKDRLVRSIVRSYFWF